MGVVLPNRLQENCDIGRNEYSVRVLILDEDSDELVIVDTPVAARRFEAQKRPSAHAPGISSCLIFPSNDHVFPIKLDG